MSLPLDSWVDVASHLSANDLLNACQTGGWITDHCQNPLFWQKLIARLDPSAIPWIDQHPILQSFSYQDIYWILKTGQSLIQYDSSVDFVQASPEYILGLLAPYDLFSEYLGDLMIVDFSLQILSRRGTHHPIDQPIRLKIRPPRFPNDAEYLSIYFRGQYVKGYYEDPEFVNGYIDLLTQANLPLIFS